MSRSYRTAPLSRRPQAAVDAFKIRSQAPLPGDRHPLTAADIESILSRVPADYLEGLKRIDLRPRLRPGGLDLVGQPYGCYYIPERLITLRSVPDDDRWFSTRRPPGFLHLAREWFGSETRLLSGCRKFDLVQTDWPKSIGVFHFYALVLLHELGHHYVYRCRTKRKLPWNRVRHETLADLHACRLFVHVFTGQADAPPPDVLAAITSEIEVLERVGKDPERS